MDILFSHEYASPKHTGTDTLHKLSNGRKAKRMHYYVSYAAESESIDSACVLRGRIVTTLLLLPYRYLLFLFVFFFFFFFYGRKIHQLNSEQRTLHSSVNVYIYVMNTAMCRYILLCSVTRMSTDACLRGKVWLNLSSNTARGIWAACDTRVFQCWIWCTLHINALLHFIKFVIYFCM